MAFYLGFKLFVKNPFRDFQYTKSLNRKNPHLWTVRYPLYGHGYSVMGIHERVILFGVPNLRTCTISVHYAFSITNISFFLYSTIIFISEEVLYMCISILSLEKICFSCLIYILLFNLYDLYMCIVRPKLTGHIIIKHFFSYYYYLGYLTNCLHSET